MADEAKRQVVPPLCEDPVADPDHFSVTLAKVERRVLAAMSAAWDKFPGGRDAIAWMQDAILNRSRSLPAVVPPRTISAAKHAEMIKEAMETQPTAAEQAELLKAMREHQQWAAVTVFPAGVTGCDCPLGRCNCGRVAVEAEAATLPPVRPLDCGPGKVFVLEVPADYLGFAPGEAERMVAQFAQLTDGSTLIILPPGCKLRGGEAPAPDAPAAAPAQAYLGEVKASWRDQPPQI